MMPAIEANCSKCGKKSFCHRYGLIDVCDSCAWQAVAKATRMKLPHVEPFAPAALRGDFAPDCDFCQDTPATNDTPAGSYCEKCSARIDEINDTYNAYDDPDTDRDAANARLKTLACEMPGWSGAKWILRTPVSERIVGRALEPREDDDSDYQDYCDRYRSDQIGAF